MLDERQQFKAAFISRCIEHGVTDPGDIAAAARQGTEKMAFLGLGQAAGSVLDTAKGLGGVALGGLAIAPPLAGLLAGNALGNAGNLNDVDAEEVRRKEKIEEYRKQIERLRRHKQPVMR